MGKQKTRWTKLLTWSEKHKEKCNLSQVNRNNDQVEGNKNSPDNILNSVSNLVEQHFFSPSKRRTMRDNEDNGFKYSNSSISLLRGLFISSTMEGAFQRSLAYISGRRIL